MQQQLAGNKRGKLRDLFYENRYVWISFFTSALIMILVYICFNVMPFGSKTVLRMDLYHQYGPLFAELYERVTNGDSLLYSWTTGMGANFLGNFFNYLSSPFSFLIFLFGHKHIPIAIAFIILLKACCASAAFTYFMKKSFGRHDMMTAGFGLLYAFCGFFVAYSWNVMWLDAMIYFPLIILGMERIIKSGKFGLFTGALALTMLCNFYMAFMTCIFCVLYFPVYYFSHHTAGERVVPAPAEGKESPWNRLWNLLLVRRGALFAFAAGVAACIAAVALLPTYFALTTSSATSGTFPETMKSYFTIFDFFANHLASLAPTIRSSGDVVLPNVYCGILTVIALPLYLFCKKISVREKLLYLALAAFLFLSFDNNVLNYIWHGFHFPNDLPYRFSFMYSFLLLVMAYRVVCNIRSFSKKEIILSAVCVIAFTIVAQKVGSKNLGELAVGISILFAAIYAGVLLALRSKRFQAGAVCALVFCCISAELAIANTDHYVMDQPFKNYTSDLDSFEAVKQSLDKREKNAQYRMELTHLRTRNDPAWYYYNGVSTFSSMAYEAVAITQRNLGLSSNNINSFTYNPQTPLYNSMLSLKYIVKNNAEAPMNSDYYTRVVQSGKFTAYENKYYLPIAYCVNRETLDWMSNVEDPFMSQEEFFKYATGNRKNLFAPVAVDAVSSTNLTGIYTGFEQGVASFTKTGGSGENASVSLDLVAPENNANLYVYIKSSEMDSATVSCSHGSWSATVDRAYVLDIGTHEPGERITVSVPVKEGKTSGTFTFYAYAVNHDVFVADYAQLQANALQIDTFDETKITGTFTNSADEILFTSIPYDKGWTVTVDGQKVETVKIDGSLLGVDVPAGTHTITFTFMPKGLVLGCGITIGTLAVLFAAALLLKKKRAASLVAANVSHGENLPQASAQKSVDIDSEESAEPLQSEDTDLS